MPNLTANLQIHEGHVKWWEVKGDYVRGPQKQIFGINHESWGMTSDVKVNSGSYQVADLLNWNKL